jgi:ParB family transcriptional regulator, chromosome partitioning protein
MAKHGLGRGLDILLPQADMAEDSLVREISISDIDPSLSQPRKSFDPEALAQLADSIRQKGLLQPILVIMHGERYRIIAGERRYRASRLAGLTTIPCLIRQFTEAEQMEASLIENIQREDLNPIEEAQAIQSLMTHFSYTQDEAAKKLGKSRPAIANQLRLLSLPEPIRQMVLKNELSAGHARVLAGVPSETRQLDLAHLCLRDGLSVRRLEELAKQPIQTAVRQLPRSLPGELTAFKETLRETVGVKTDVVGTARKGKIIFTYNSSEELDHLYDVFSKITR